MPVPILQIDKLTKHFYGVMAIDGLTVSIGTGDITSIIGPNGSGKTTLINTLSGMLPMDGGSVVIDGSLKLKKIISHKVPSYGMTRTFQDVRLFEQMKALDNILVVLTERNILSAIFERHRAHHLKQAEDVLKRVGLWEKRDELTVNLSYGQRKLLEIARVLALSNTGQARIMLFDEPFAGLFPQMVKTVSSIIRELKKDGRSVVLIEHNMDLIRELSDHVIVMDSGKLLAEGGAKEVLEKKEVIEAYLGE